MSKEARGRALECPLSQCPLSRHQTEIRYAKILPEDTRTGLVGELPMQLHKVLHLEYVL